MNEASVNKPLRHQLIITAVILFLTAIIVVTLFSPQENVSSSAPIQKQTQIVTVFTAERAAYTLPIEARGLVEPKRQLNLVGQVMGSVTYISDKFAVGNAFKKGDVLLKVDTHYLNMELQKANVAHQQALLHQLEIKAQSAANTEDTSNNLALAMANSAVNAALAGLQLAQQQFAAANLTAPFDGRVITRVIQEQDQLIIGRPIGQIYATDTLQLRIALTPEQLILLGAIGDKTHAISATNNAHLWQGYLTRSESMIAANRMIYVIADIPLTKNEEQPLLGSLLSVSLQSLPQPNLIRIPLSALPNNHSIWLVDKQQQLIAKPVQLIYQTNNDAYINGDIINGDLIVNTPPAEAYNGMTVVIKHSSEQPLTP